MVVGEIKRTSNIMDGIENTGDVRLHDHRLRLKQRFDIVRKLGQGTYGKVQLGINKKTGQEVAIKTIKKCKIETEADLIRIRREVQIMSSVRHPNIVHIYEVFENSEKMILVMEYCSGGELYDYLSQKKVLEEDEARRLFRQIATAVYYCHIHKICHRDLKLENVLLDDTGSAKIADFGLSNVFKETSLLSTFCGSPLYASPEIVKGTPYIGPEVDCWSLGVLLYTLVYGAMPFDGSNFKRLVRQISNGYYYEPKNPSTASHLIRDMLTVDPLKRADIAYICDHPWVNTGCPTSCLEMAESLAAETPVRLDLLLSLAPAAPSSSNSVVVPPEAELRPEESCTDLTSSTSMAVEPSNSAEKRILDLVAEGGEDAIKPSPTRTLVSAEHKRKMDSLKDRVASCASMGRLPTALPEEDAKLESPPPEHSEDELQTIQPTLKTSATITIAPAPPQPQVIQEPVKTIETPKEEEKEKPKPKVVNKVSPLKIEDKPNKIDEPKEEKVATIPSPEKLTATSTAPAASAPAPAPATVHAKPKKLSIGGHVGSFAEKFERRNSLNTAPEIKRNISKPVVSKIAKPKAQSEDRELTAKSPETGTVRLQQIGIEPSQSSSQTNEPRESRGVLKTESEPAHCSTRVDPAELLQDARRSLQNSMAKLTEERLGEDSRRRAARDIISSAIRTGKPPVPYGRSSSAGVASLASPPGTPPAPPPHSASPRVFRTEASHRVEDHRPRGVSVERIIPITMSGEEPPARACVTPVTPVTPITPMSPPAASPTNARIMNQKTPLRRLTSSESTSEAGPGEPIKKSAREFIIPIAVEGKGYVTPRQRSLEPDTAPRRTRPRRLGSLVSGGESEEEDDTHMHRLRSTRAARAESVSSGEEDEEDEGFHILTAENLFSTLLHRVRALTQRLNGEEGPGFQHPHSLFNNLQSPFFNRREGWGGRELHAPFDSLFSSRPRGSSKKTGKHRPQPSQNSEAPAEALDLSDLDLSSIEFSEREMAALSGLTPALSRRLQRQLLAHLPPRAAARLRRTLSLHAPASNAPPTSPAPPSTHRCHSVEEALQDRPTDIEIDPPLGETSAQNVPAEDANIVKPTVETPKTTELDGIKTDSNHADLPVSQYCTLPRLRRRSTVSADNASSASTGDVKDENSHKLETPPAESVSSKLGYVRCSSDRPLLSKYLAPDRNLSLDETYNSSDGGSILTEPSYIAAYGSSTLGNSSGLGFRRHSLRLSGENAKKRVSRFLRSDFFDNPSDESLYIKHKKEKEMETQKILREIREKKSKSIETAKSPTEASEFKSGVKDECPVKKCLSPVGNLLLKDRSRSNTPFFPILDNIKETALDSIRPLKSILQESDELENKEKDKDNILNKESKMIRPKSYPIKSLETYGDANKSIASLESSEKTQNIIEEKKVSKESKLMRPKSYPTGSPSPEKAYVNRNNKKDEINVSKDTINSAENKTDIEVSFNLTLPKRNKPLVKKSDSLKKVDLGDTKVDSKMQNKKDVESTLSIKKYQVINDNKTEVKDNKSLGQNNLNETLKCKKTTSVKDDSKTISVESQSDDKKEVKKKIIKRISSKSKTDISASDDPKTSVEKKKVTKKVKDKPSDDSKTSITKKRSVLQSIGHKLEKFASSKSSSPEKVASNGLTKDLNKDSSNRTQREQSVPVIIDPPTESNLLKRAVTITDVAALENQSNNQNKTAVSKVLGLFKKFETKEKLSEPIVEKKIVENIANSSSFKNNSPNVDSEEKAKRPTSLLLNGLGRKNRYSRSSSDDNNKETIEIEDPQVLKKKDTESKNIRNTLKLDFSRLPRVKKIVPTNPVIEPQMFNTSDIEKNIDSNHIIEKNGIIIDDKSKVDSNDTQTRSRSRSRSTYSNSDIKSDLGIKEKIVASDTPIPNINLRNHESITPEKEDIVDRIRRKSFYSRFNEKKQRRKSNLVGPGAVEYDPLSRIQSQVSDSKYDVSPTSPGTYDLSPGLSIGSDVSPSTERYRSLLSDLPLSSRGNLRYHGVNDKIDMYRSLDRNEFRKYPGSKSYLDYDQPLSYNSNRYSRTKSLFDSSDTTEEDNTFVLPRETQKYNRTNSLFSPGSYATYRPKRTRNSAIILKESEKEPSPENILDKIRQRKISISVTRKPDHEKEPTPRSNLSSKGESDGSERSTKID